VREFISCRRAFLDRFLFDNQSRLSGRVLDIGGQKVTPRGDFRPPLGQVSSWIYVNPDWRAAADIAGALPYLPFRDQSFDAVVCTEVLEYVLEVKSAIAEIARVLDSEGVAVVSVPFLHRSHDDSTLDCHRFTFGLLERLFVPYFSCVRIIPMGSAAAVIFDLLWPRFQRLRLLRPFMRMLGRWIVARADHKSDMCTGFFVLAQKERRQDV